MTAPELDPALVEVAARAVAIARYGVSPEHVDHMVSEYGWEHWLPDIPRDVVTTLTAVLPALTAQLQAPFMALVEEVAEKVREDIALWVEGATVGSDRRPAFPGGERVAASIRCGGYESPDLRALLDPTAARDVLESDAVRQVEQDCCPDLTFEEHLEQHHATDTPDGL